MLVNMSPKFFKLFIFMSLFFTLATTIQVCILADESRTLRRETAQLSKEVNNLRKILSKSSCKELLESKKNVNTK